MYSCVFWSEFIDLIGFFLPVLCGRCHSLYNNKGSTEKQPDLVYSKAVCGPKTHRIGDFSRPKTNFYHRYTAVNV